MIYIVVIFLWVAILFYLLMGGADFGAGILELFTSDKNKGKTRRTLYHAIGPVWEANHMWLIIAVVILFVGFPGIYATLSVYLHIPLTIMLLGIIARGSAFAFRHYDAIVDDMQHLYNKIFVYSSFVTPFFLGIIAGSTVSGKINDQAVAFVPAYILSWLSLFSISVGFFTVAICGFLAAIYIIGETAHDQPEKARFVRKARFMIVAAVICGALVFLAAYIEDIPIIHWFFGNPVGIAAIAAATLSLIALWMQLDTRRTRILRLLAGFQVTMILLTTTYAHFPNIVILKSGRFLSLLDQAGSDKTINALGYALLIGSVFILPALGYLIYSFQKRGK